MSLLLSCQSIGKAFGATPLFADLSLGIFEGDRIGLVGPNGAGKSTLLKILAGIETPDRGTLAPRKSLRLGWVPQDPVFDAGQSVEEVIHAAIAGGELDDDERHARVRSTIARAAFPDPEQLAGSLSGGWTKRLAISCALAQAPDLLLMDEPTNHLDVEGILWLERLLRSDALAYLVVSHDRWFLENVAERIVELNRAYVGGVLDSRGSYAAFLEKKDEILRGQERYQESLANRVRNEIEWLKRGPKARTRKSSARIQDAADLQTELAAVARRTTQRAARVELNASERRTKRLLVAEGIERQAGGRVLFSGLDVTLSPGVRLGILGPNGSGKTTLLRVLAGELEPDAGTVMRADDLRVVYLDQKRDDIEAGVTLRRALAPQGDQVVYRDRPIHVAGWARRFLFGSEQLDMPVDRLSGGERARVALARLMLRPADVLMLDEPTNDLDIPTLEILEESLVEFPGAVVLVTHDRFLFERVSTVVLALDGKGEAEVYADYRQWEEARRQPQAEERSTAAPGPRPAPAGTKRLSYKEKREWESIESTIAEAEAALEACRIAAEDPAIATDAAQLQARHAALDAARAEVDRLYARWAELESALKSLPSS